MLSKLRRRTALARCLVLVAVAMATVVCIPRGALAQASEAEEQEAAEPDFDGNFLLSFEPAKNEALAPFERAAREADIFPTMVDELNQTIALPKDLPIFFAQCDAVNAFYSRQDTRIIVCYELLAYFTQKFGSVYEKPDEAQAAVINATIFVLQHELGHALVDLLQLPITGKEEDAVDDLATLVLLHDWEGGDELALDGADAFYMMGEDEEQAAAQAAAEDIEAMPYYGEHSLGKQRFYEVVCIVYGSDPEAYASLVPEQLPEARAVRCPREYEQKANSWDTLLADYYKAADDEQADDDEPEADDNEE
jgi:hypothetical protein